jgi:serine/threonine protein kinase
MLKEGLVFADRYKFIKQLGRGGFAEVWLAEDIKTGVQVAVKVYAPGGGLDENGIKIFTQEFAGVFDMNHTNLLRPTHYDIFEQQPYLIMPYIKNGSAFKYIVEGQNIPEDECWKMLHDVAAGLAYLHEKMPPLIHQDIKPDNIMIDDEGRYLITDFGISARVRSTIRGALAQEQSGGTLAYMGPERFSANPKPIMASDIWSLGAMMYELMTGTPPFGNHGGVLQKNGADIPIIEGDYSQELKDIIYSCLAKETWDRPSARKIEEQTYNKLHGIAADPEAKGTTVLSEAGPVRSQTEVSAPQPLTQKKGMNKGVIIGAIAAAIIIIGAIIALSGGSDDADPAVTEVAEPVIVINYDSLSQVSIKESLALIEQADTFITNHEDDKFDDKYNKVEDIYLSALSKLDEALASKDSLSASVSTEATVQKSNVKNKLLGLYKELKESAQYVPEYGQRAEAIAVAISDMIENEPQNEDNNDNN